jgi:hypothetical protein
MTATTATQEGQLFDLFLFDPDNGDLVRVIKGIDSVLAKPMAMDYHAMEGFAVKIVDQFDGCVTYTLGI